MKLVKKIAYYKLMEEHQKLIKQGQLFEARRLLHFLINKNVTLGFSDIDWCINNLCENVGLKVCINSRGIAYVSL